MSVSSSSCSSGSSSCSSWLALLAVISVLSIVVMDSVSVVVLEVALVVSVAVVVVDVVVVFFAEACIMERRFLCVESSLVASSVRLVVDRELLVDTAGGVFLARFSSSFPFLYSIYAIKNVRTKLSASAHNNTCR